MCVKDKTDTEAFEVLPPLISRLDADLHTTLKRTISKLCEDRQQNSESLGVCSAFGAFVLRQRLAHDRIDHSYPGQWSNPVLLCI